MITWVHCNICYLQPCSEAPRFFITSCGHIYCEKCVEKVPPEKCSMCQTPFTATELSPEPPKYTALKNETIKLGEENSRLRKRVKQQDLEIGWYKSQVGQLKHKLNNISKDPRMMSASGHGRAYVDLSPAPSDTSAASPVFNFRSQNAQGLPTGSAANKYRYQTASTPFSPVNRFLTPSTSGISSGYSQRGSAFSRGSDVSGGGHHPLVSARGANTMQTPQEFSSPSVLRPLNFQNQHTPLFRKK